MTGIAIGLLAAPAAAQQGASIFGRVTDASTGAAIAGASIRVEGESAVAVSDSAGRYMLAGIPAGPRALIVQRIGYAPARVSITVPPRGLLNRNVQLAETALQLPTLSVTAEPGGRARGELGTATVIGREAIEVQNATSLAGILELVPGVPLEPPGLGGVQQFALRSVPTSSVSGLVVGGPTPEQLASSGTLIILDGVPLSNNANLQTTGPRGEVRVPSSAGGGVDLRRIPASTIERVDVIRGVPSARYGDLTQGAIVVETRAGAFSPDLRLLFDPHSSGGGFAGGWSVGEGALSATADLTRTRISPGWLEDEAYRFSAQLAHRTGFGAAEGALGDRGAGAAVPRLALDTRVDLFQVFEERPEDPGVFPGRASSNRDGGLRLSERARLLTQSGLTFDFTGSLEYQRQRSFVQRLLNRRAMPFTDRVTEGRAEGGYVAGDYLSRLRLDGDAWNVFSRLEAVRRSSWLGLDHRLRAGTVLRREWNSGAGYQFDIDAPPQASFNGVEGFDRPRAFDAIPPLVTSALYVDDRIFHVFPPDVAAELQAGLRADVLHEGDQWASGVGDIVVQPRLNGQVSPWAWMRLRAAWGVTAKAPTLGQLQPAPQYYDIVNVNWFADDPVERLAILTTFIRDPRNERLGFAVGRKTEVGAELASTGGEWSLSVAAFRDRTDGAIGFRSEPGFLLRDRYALRDSVIGDGRPTEIVEPPTHADTIPILLDVPDNNLILENDGVEVTVRFPEIRALRTRLEVQGAWIDTRLEKEGLDFGLRFRDFQVDERVPRSPFWESVTNTGVRGLATYRLVHHRPDLGLVITSTIQHIFKEERQNLAGTDTLAFAGYITRSGELVFVPAAERGLPAFSDLRQPRANTLIQRNAVAPDWLLSLQVSLDLPLRGRLSFYAFNALDRKGVLGTTDRQGRRFPALRFGLEGSFAPAAVADALGRALGRER